MPGFKQQFTHGDTQAWEMRALVGESHEGLALVPLNRQAVRRMWVNRYRSRHPLGCITSHRRIRSHGSWNSFVESHETECATCAAQEVWRPDFSRTAGALPRSLDSIALGTSPLSQAVPAKRWNSKLSDVPEHASAVDHCQYRGESVQGPVVEDKR